MKRATLIMFIIAAVVIIATMFLSAANAQHSEGYKLIVNSANTVTALERKFIEDAFLKRVTKWPNGRSVQPVDGKPKSQVRKYFSENIMKRPPMAIRNYWQVQVFGGRDIPPPELGADEDIIAYVARRPGAIGYVSIYAEIDATMVKTVSVK